MLVKAAKGIASSFKIAFVNTINQVLFPYEMNRSEALKILNLENDFKTEELNSKFKKFYFANSLEKKGSPYIQSKIKNAYEYLKK